MIEVKLKHNPQGYISIRCSGHAGFAEAGSDIICAAVSMLVVNTINGIEQYTEDAFTVDTAEGENAFIDFAFTEAPSHDSALLMEVMVMGLKQLQADYGSTYLTLHIQEV